MTDTKNFSNIPPEGIETPKGKLYPLRKTGIQVLFFAVSFLTAIFLGWFISTIAGEISMLAKVIIYAVYIIIYMLGYMSWAGIISVLLFKSVKMPMMKIFYRYFIHKQKPASLSELLPTKEEAAELLVRTQKAARMFFILSWLIGIAGSFVIMFFKTSINSIILMAIIIITSVLFGFTLSYFGRRGYLPFPVEQQ